MGGRDREMRSWWMGEGGRGPMVGGEGVVLTSFVISNIVKCEEAIFVALFVSAPP